MKNDSNNPSLINQAGINWRKRFWLAFISTLIVIAASISFFAVYFTKTSKYIVTDADLKILDYKDFLSIHYFLSFYTKANDNPDIHPVELLGYGIGENGELWMKFSTIKLKDPNDSSVYSKWKNVSIHFWPQENWPQDPGNISFGFDYEDVDDMDVIIDENELYKKQLEEKQGI